MSINLPANRYTVEITPTDLHGWFEHNLIGDESGGELWFEHNGEKLVLIDYDGTPYLPDDVFDALQKYGVIVSDDFSNKD